MAANQEISSKPQILKEESTQLQNARSNLDTLTGAYQEYAAIYESRISPSLKETSVFLSEEEIRQLYNSTQEKIKDASSEYEKEIIEVCFNSLINGIEHDPERIFSRISPTVDYFQFYFKDRFGQVIGLQEPSRLIAWTNKRE